MGFKKYIKRKKKYADISICKELFNNNVVYDTNLVFIEILYDLKGKMGGDTIIVHPDEIETFKKLNVSGEYKFDIICPVYTKDYANKSLKVIREYNENKEEIKNRLYTYIGDRKLWVVLNKYRKITRENIKSKFKKVYDEVFK